MNLLESIVGANQQRPAGQVRAEVRLDDFRASLPLVALTCIDVRLNHLFPDALGLAEDQFIWLRNSGNIIFDPMSSMMRTLALACAIKGGREIAVIGHTDCLVCKTSVMQLTDRFKALGVDRTRLPENLNEFFGLFASERQNVMKAVETVRSSPLIGPKVPVHGLLMEIPSGRLEWLVNGYTALDSVTSQIAETIRQSLPQGGQIGRLESFTLGEMKFPDFAIGEHNQPSDFAQPAQERPQEGGHTWAKPEHPAIPAALPVPGAQGADARRESTSETAATLNPRQIFRIIGGDQKQYGPVSGAKLLEWIADGRIDWKTPAQAAGASAWKPLSSWVQKVKPPAIPIPPEISTLLKPHDRQRR